MKNIVILGGSYAGMAAAHQFLKQPEKNGPVKVTLVTPNTHFYWNVASPRGILPGEIPDEQLFQPIADGFKQYPAGKFELIVASAESLDVKAKKVVTTSHRGESKTLTYDILILATGSRASGGMPLKGLGTTEATKNAFHELQSQISNSKTIVIAGAGVTGCEIAGELGYKYGKQKEIVLLCSDASVLKKSPSSVSKLTAKELTNLGVDVKLQEKVTSSSKLPDGRQELTLSGGDKLIADTYIPAFGLIPNTSYVPAEFLDQSGSVVVDDSLQVKGAGPVWAIGDVSSLDASQYMAANRQASHAVKNIGLYLSGKPMLAYKPWPHSLGFQIGKKAGTGHLGSWKLPSFVVVFMRKTLFVERFPPTVDGSLF
ncbi:FAD/NAD(P)-binding domain-containing protein [Thozetella sp. PMI_491]|nr:FAD/NAD(P)-binding domain-containing protein [Thozetella sp. PMI_491]